MSKLGITFNILVVVTAPFVAFGGLHEFDQANNTVELLRGLFWLMVGTGAFLTAFYDLRQEFGNGRQ